jgi:hypothetical protein
VQSEGSLPHSQEPTNCPYPEPDRSSLGSTQVSVRFGGFCDWFITWLSFYGEEFSAPRSTPSEGPPFVGCPRLLIQYIRSYLPYLQAVPPSASWGRAMPTYHGDRDPLITVTGTHLTRWQGPAYHGDRDPIVRVAVTYLSRIDLVIQDYNNA